MAMQPGILDPQMRALDDNVGPSRTQVITVTSGKGGVGKTNVVANTAIALAQTGKRVLVLDADLGRAHVILVGLELNRRRDELGGVGQGEFERGDLRPGAGEELETNLEPALLRCNLRCKR